MYDTAGLLIWFYSFFFFKQKTAYEMRISDWSSDVCSSDLAGIPGTEHADGQADPGSSGWESPAPASDLPGRAGTVSVRRRPPREIGRASCRERVYQYV